MAKFKLKKDTFKAKALAKRAKQFKEERKQFKDTWKRNSAPGRDMTKKTWQNRNLSMWK